MHKINLSEILHFEDLTTVKFRFNLMFHGNWDPIETFKNNDYKALIEGQYWNYRKQKSFKVGQTTVGFIKMKGNEDLWLLFHIGKITKDLDIYNGTGYEFETLNQYQKYFGRLIIRYKNRSQNMIRYAGSVIEDCFVEQILPDIFDNDIFPGYDKVNISYDELKRVVDKESWKTALQNQKGVYLITDISNGKMYVGSAYGDEMILSRWKNYVKSGNGNNKKLKELEFGHIKENLRFSILDIFKSTTDQNLIIQRENWWKEILMTRKFGYNSN